MEILLKKDGEAIARKAAYIAAGTVGFALLTCAGAAIRIPLPFSPVPLTLQTFFVLLSGAMLGGVAGSVSQLLYLALGLAGYSVFTSPGAGALYLCGPTGGGILGFVLASLACGLLLKNARSFAAVFAVFLLCSLGILVVGTAWLRFVTGASYGHAAAMGIMPFIPGDIVKSLTAAALVTRYRKLSGSRI